MTRIVEVPRDWVLHSQLTKARKFLGFSLDEVAAKVGIPSADLELWEREKGGASPTAEQLYDLAQLYGRPMAYFFKELPDPPLQDFRRPSGAEASLSGETRRTILEFEEWCYRQAELEGLLDKTISADIPKVAPRAPWAVAEAERARLRLGRGPLKSGEVHTFDCLRSALQAKGVKVFALAVPDRELSGYSWWHPQVGPAILVNRKGETRERRAFTLAHEYAHLLLRNDGSVCSFFIGRDPQERFANRFAAALLVPKEHFLANLNRRGWDGKEHWSDYAISELAKDYGVSREVIAICLEEVERAPSGFADRRIAEWRAKSGAFRGRGKGGRPPTWQMRLYEVGATFAKLVYDAYAQERLPLSRLADYLRLTPERTEQAIAYLARDFKET
jgi:Zn-dependent peptidase ImmA (M78 family)/transcriptional regulator with XRE-family HTH domain